MSTAHMIRGVLLACGLLLTAACSAHNDGSPTASAVAASAQAAARPEAPVSAASTTFTEGKEEEMLGRLQQRLGRSKEEIRSMVESM